MNTKTILGLSFAVVFAASMLGSAYASGHLDITGITVEKSGRNGVNQSVHIDVSADVPAPDGGDYGWAVGPTSKGGFLVITSHPNIGDDSTGQHPPSDPASDEYHTHYLTAEVSGPNCGTDNHATFATPNEVGILSIDGDQIWVENVPRGLAGNLPLTGFSFTLSASGGDLCITGVDTFP